MQDLDPAIVLTLANLFAGNRTDAAVIGEALKLICTTADSQCGVIYGLDDTNQYVPMEILQKSASKLPHSLSAEYFTLGERKLLASKNLHLLHRKFENTPMEGHFLGLCEVDTLLLAPVMDNEFYLYGFVLLTGFMDSFEGERLLQQLKTPLSLLTRYISTEMLQKRIRRSRMSLEDILDNTNIDIYVNDFHTHEILYVNESMAAPYGGKRAFDGQKCWQVLFPGQGGPCEFCPKYMLTDENGMPTKVYSWDYQRAFDGSWFRVFSAAFRWENGRIAHIVSSADITDNKRNEAIIENMANYDQLTKLPNRRMLLKDCKQRINNATEQEQGYVLFFDIDGFKAINDTYGHDAGDEFLILLGEFFSGIPLIKNSTYRNGGDEFVAIVGGEAVTKAHIQSLASFIHARFKKPWKLKNGDAYCGTSIGVACYPEDGKSPEILLQKADQAMYHVKKRGGNGLCFRYQMEQGK